MVSKLDRAVLAEDTDDGRVALIETFLRKRRPVPDENVTRLSEMVYAVASERGILKVEDLVQRYGVNKRTLQRLFAKYVGVSPKWVIQRYRLHEAAERLAADREVGQAALALSLGYTDQAHFVRDFKTTVGTSPGRLRPVARELTRYRCIVATSSLHPEPQRETDRIAWVNGTFSGCTRSRSST